jgi:hypothetical protein
MDSNDGRNPNIPSTAYELVGGPQGKLEMGHFSLDVLFYLKTGQWPPPPSERPRWRFKCFESSTRE